MKSKKNQNTIRIKSEYKRRNDNEDAIDLVPRFVAYSDSVKSEKEKEIFSNESTYITLIKVIIDKSRGEVSLLE